MSVIPGEVNMVWQVVVQVGEGNFVFCPDGLTDDDFVNVIELIPVLISAGDETELEYSKIKAHNHLASFCFKILFPFSLENLSTSDLAGRQNLYHIILNSNKKFYSFLP